MSQLLIDSHSPETTQSTASQLAGHLVPGDVLALCGELGSGKTCFTKGLARGLGANPRAVTSPTFVLMNVYEGRLPIYHFDAYRLSDSDAFLDLGAEEYLYGNGVSVVEWADRVLEALPEDCLEIHFTHQGLSDRKLEWNPTGPRSTEILEQVKVTRCCGDPQKNA